MEERRKREEGGEEPQRAPRLPEGIEGGRGRERQTAHQGPGVAVREQKKQLRAA